MRPSVWMSLKNVVLAVSMSMVMAACSPARWHETKGQPENPVAQGPVLQQDPSPRGPRPTVNPPNGQNQNERCGRFSGKPCPEDEKKTDETTKVDEDEDDGDDDEKVVEKPAPKKEDKKSDEEVGGEVIENEEKPAPKPRQKPKCCVQVKPEPCPPGQRIPMRKGGGQNGGGVVENETGEIGPDTYFVIQNIATGKLRVYETARQDGRPHKLVLETEMVVGRNNRGDRSILGHFQITKWAKFYEDKDGQYPAFFNPRYPELPEAGLSLDAWLSKQLLPQRHGRIRGLYGWYSAFLAPDADNEGMYGTWGWGADGDSFIKKTRASRDRRVQSRGGTRVENRAIALMRELLVPGTRVLRIYAREAYVRPEAVVRKNGAIGSWPWALTREMTNFPAGRNGVNSRGVKASMVLEEGVYEFDQTPTAFVGNEYRVSEDDFRGVLLVDAGRLMGYAHPEKLDVGGHGSPIPNQFRARAGLKIYRPGEAAAIAKKAAKEEAKDAARKDAKDEFRTEDGEEEKGFAR